MIPVTTGSRTLKDAINEAYRDWVASVETTNYIFGTAAGPHPFPAMVRDFQKIIGEETRAEFLERLGRLPDAVFACVGGGSNAIGMFDAFLDDEGVALYGVEAAGDGVDTPSTRPRSSGVAPASCTARAPTCCRTKTARPRVALDLGRPRLPGRRSRARVARRHRPRAVHPGHRRRGDAGPRLLSRTEGIIPASSRPTPSPEPCASVASWVRMP